MPPPGTASLARRLGRRISDLRQERGLTQEKLAWECDLAKPYLSQIESGKRVPTLGTLARIAARLGVELVHLVAVEAAAPTAQLLEAVRRRDKKAARAALTQLRLA